MNATIQVKERGIIFGAEMIRAILEGRKTQTRRVMKPQPAANDPWKECEWCVVKGIARFNLTDEQLRSGSLPWCPFGQPGDRLWVRETYWTNGDNIMLRRATDETLAAHATEFDRWRSPRFMPKRASRITLEIADVRVERVQEISAEDCRAEGVDVKRFEYRAGELSPCCPMSEEEAARVEYAAWGAEKLSLRCMSSTEDAALPRAFRKLWNKINAPRGYGWDANPWVWALTFRRVED